VAYIGRSKTEFVCVCVCVCVCVQREATVVFEKHFPELLTYDIDLNSQPLLQVIIVLC
jgi:hypothetical protein